MKKGMRAGAALLAAAMLLAGCSGNPGTADGTTAAEQTGAQTETQSQTDVQTQTEEGLGMKDGTYEAEARGFNLTQMVQVTVEIQDNQIVSIAIGENGETNGMPQMVEKYMIPRIIENQTLAVDAVTGATSTSMAVRSAVSDCLEQAGADLSLMQTP